MTTIGDMFNTDTAYMRLLFFRVSRLNILEHANWNALDKIKVVDYVTLPQLNVSNPMVGHVHHKTIFMYRMS